MCVPDIFEGGSMRARGKYVVLIKQVKLRDVVSKAQIGIKEKMV